MKCPAVDTLILYHYRELSHRQSEDVKVHLDACGVCKQAYQRLLQDCGALRTERFELSSQEIESMLGEVRRVLDQRRAKSWRERIIPTGDRLETASRKVLVPVLAMCLAFVVVMPIVGRQRALEKEFAILQLQLEMAVEEEDVSMFELYDEPSGDGQSQRNGCFLAA